MATNPIFGKPQAQSSSSLRLFGIGILVVVIALSAIWYFVFRRPAEGPVVTNDEQPTSPNSESVAETNAEAAKILQAIELFRSLPSLQTDIFQDEKFRSLIDTSVVIDPPRRPARRRLQLTAPAAPEKKK